MASNVAMEECTDDREYHNTNDKTAIIDEANNPKDDRTGNTEDNATNMFSSNLNDTRNRRRYLRLSIADR
jgi:hypothetical protein